MFKKMIVILFLVMPLSSCSSLGEFNEKIKGDGVPYIPGV
tara:strand:+ start:520 stop:639 length:120 start_codon:yes stop_codon:yes gene_type:complete